MLVEPRVKTHASHRPDVRVFPRSHKLQLSWKYDQESINWEELSNLYKIAPLGDKKADNLQRTFSNSMFKCFVFKDSQLVGVGRALADGVDCSYICDVAVHPEHQGTGIGKSIVKKLTRLSEGHKKLFYVQIPARKDYTRHLASSV